MSKTVCLLTQKISEPLRLFVVLHSHCDRIEEHQNDDKPIEPLSFDGMANPESEPFFCQPKTFAASLIRHFWFKIS